MHQTRPGRTNMGVQARCIATTHSPCCSSQALLSGASNNQQQEESRISTAGPSTCRKGYSCKQHAWDCQCAVPLLALTLLQERKVRTAPVRRKWTEANHDSHSSMPLITVKPSQHQVSTAPLRGMQHTEPSKRHTAIAKMHATSTTHPPPGTLQLGLHVHAADR